RCSGSSSSSTPSTTYRSASSRITRAMDRVGDAFVWPVRDPEWPGKLLIIALTLLIPIVGAINGLGWMLATLDRLRAGEEHMAPANLSYIGRGAPLFVVQLGYGLAVAAV